MMLQQLGLTAMLAPLMSRGLKMRWQTVSGCHQLERRKVLKEREHRVGP